MVGDIGFTFKDMCECLSKFSQMFSPIFSIYEKYKSNIRRRIENIWQWCCHTTVVPVTPALQNGASHFCVFLIEHIADWFLISCKYLISIHDFVVKKSHE